MPDTTTRLSKVFAADILTKVNDDVNILITLQYAEYITMLDETR